MNADRRAELSAAAQRHVAAVSEDVVASWSDLLPAAGEWRKEAHDRAVLASNAAVTALPRIIAQGDLDDQGWHELRQLVLPHGYLIASELLRAVVIEGVERLADELVVDAGLTHEERWQLQQEVSNFTETLLLERTEPETGAYEQLLADLHRSGPDLE